jgi:predicted nucleic acid-binding protein
MFKKGRVTREEALKGVAIFESIPIRYAIPRLNQAVDLAHRLGIYAYDAYVLECALRFKGPLLTLDRQLIDQAKGLDVACLEV